MVEWWSGLLVGGWYSWCLWDAGFAALLESIVVRFSLRRLLVVVLCLAVLLALLRSAQTARRTAMRLTAQGSLNQLSLALHNYHEVYGCFPPAITVDVSGRPMHSWRVLILPYMEEQTLYASYRMNEPWDGPNNSRLANQMPRMFRSYTEPESTEFTNVVAVTGLGTAFPPGDTTALSDFLDGPGNSIMLTEISESKVPWLQPRDLEVANFAVGEPSDSRINISAVSWRRPLVVFADSIQAFTVRPGASIEELKALMTIAGSESVTKEQLVKRGDLGL